MNAEFKDEISARRMNGEGYKLIASELGLNLNSVRSYCKRAGNNHKPITKAPPSQFAPLKY